MELQILEALRWIIILILSLTVHEYSHARAAAMLGDRTADRMGRLTLNPVPHIDPVGTIMLPMIGILFHAPVFGWAKPVPVNAVNFRRGIRMKIGMLLVAAAGPASNLAMALLASILLFLVYQVGGLGLLSDTFVFFHSFIYLNVLLAFFNLMPIPPLDGGRILAGVLPDRYEPILMQIERFGFMILIFLLLTGAFKIIAYPVVLVANLLLTLPLPSEIASQIGL